MASKELSDLRNQLQLRKMRADRISELAADQQAQQESREEAWVDSLQIARAQIVALTTALEEAKRQEDAWRKQWP